MTKKKEIVSTKLAAEAIGPYNQAIKYGDLVFTSGQIPLTPEGHIVSDNIEDQAKKVLENLKHVLEAGGSSMENVIKTTIFLADMNDFPVVNEIYDEAFGGNFPARSTVQVARLPKDVLIEIEAIAHI